MPFPITTFIDTLELLCSVKFERKLRARAILQMNRAFSKMTKKTEFTVNQLNEVLLLLNERIVTKEFFSFLASSKVLGEEQKDTIALSEFRDRVQEFRKLGMLRFGSFRFAYNLLSEETKIAPHFARWMRSKKQCLQELAKRQKPVCEIESIPESNLWMLGYISGKNVDKSIQAKVRKIGKSNYYTYLTWDYLDVYVATSMRTKEEFVEVHKTCKQVFSDSRLKSLSVRYFDPTLSYHDDSTAKGLVECLMLKRSKCTLYMVQESDTMGKDSEMAATLAQGKPVVAYVPRLGASQVRKVMDKRQVDDNLKSVSRLRKFLKPSEARRFTKCEQVILDVKNEARLDVARSKQLLGKYKAEYEEMLDLLAQCEVRFFDKRAEYLTHSHPLRLQMDLDTGVANGVLVARDIDTCCELIHRILTNSLEFSIIECGEKGTGANSKPDRYNYRLIESVSGCAFRVVTKDPKLTNSFWNLYLLEEKRDDKNLLG